MENYNDYNNGFDGKNRRGRGMRSGVVALIVIIAIVVGTVGGAALIYYYTGGSQNHPIEGTNAPAPSDGVTVIPGQSDKPNVTINPSFDPNVTALPEITPPTIDGTEPIADIYEKMKDTVVFVSNYSDESTLSSTGSGVFISSDGYIVTNYHVIENAVKVTVRLYGSDEEHRTTVVGGDKRTDLAVLKLNGGTYHAAALGSSASLRVGQYVVAIGNPLGYEYADSVTHGVISGLNRAVDEKGIRQRLLQTDCPINPGNSGGPLFNMKGEVIGITSLKEVYTTGEEGQIPVDNIGFAIPSDTVKSIALTLISKGKIERGALGITAQTNVRNNNEDGVKVVEVTAGSPAAKAGLKKGDIIRAIDGVEVKKMEDLSEQLSYKSVGQTVTIRFDRGTKEMTVNVTLTVLNE